MTYVWRCCSYGAILITIASGIVAYNFDVNNLIVYEDAAKSGRFRESYSGFSVALWNADGGRLDKSWIFIGSPRANSTQYPRIIEPGTVFKCKIGKPCQEWVMDQDTKQGPGNGSWLGGSMGIEDKPNPHVMVCGPRWLNENFDPETIYAWPMSGMCYQASAKDLTDSNTTKGIGTYPLQALYHSNGAGVSKYVMAESGFSIHIVPDGSRSILLGAPGLESAKGRSIKYSFEDRMFTFPDTGTSRSYVNTYDYSGYAVTSGRYFGPKVARFYASSAPRSNNLYGKIIIFNFEKQVGIQVGKQVGIQVGKQVGEYFGYALASCDINGDQFDDLIVGAPQWTKIVDEGRIYIYNGGVRGISEASNNFQGESPRARFGSAITCLGDIDHDGFEDIAVGAPYDGNGVVYIYHGSPNGIRLSQKISAPKDTKGFGISISQPKDIDGNGHADIAVGAYLSGHVTVFRSKRAVITNVKLTTDLSGGSLQPNASSFDVKVCSSYRGDYAPKKLNVTTELKIDESLQRAEISADGINVGNYIHQFSDILDLRSKSCKNFTINMKNGDKHYLEALKLSVIQRLNTNINYGTLLVGEKSVSGKDHFDESAAVIDEIRSVDRSYLEIPFALQCNDSCNSNLTIGMVTNLGNDHYYAISSDLNIELNITVNNSGDPAYRAQAVIIIPFPVQLIQIPSSCRRLPIGKDTQVTWEIANLLDRNEMRTETLILDMSPLSSNTTKISLNATATTQSNNTAASISGRDKAQLLINCKALTDIGIRRKSTDDRYSYTLKGNNEQVPNIAFQHSYEIKNYQVTRIDQVVLSISIPTHYVKSGNEIEIVRINKTTGYLGGQEFYCSDLGTDKEIIPSSHDANTMTEWLSGPMPDEKFTIIDGRVVSSSAYNMTININCTNPSVKCKMINCLLGPFTSSQSVAKISLMFDLLLSNFTSEIIERENIIFFVTNGSVSILESPGETAHNKTNFIMIGTTFTGSPPESRVPVWIIAVSILFGLLLLLLVILALFKFGFFKRDKQMALRALLKEQDQAAPATDPNSTSNT